MAWVIAKGAVAVWTVMGGVAEVAAKRTVVAMATILGVARGALSTVGAFVFCTVDTKMPLGMALKTTIC